MMVRTKNGRFGIKASNLIARSHSAFLIFECVCSFKLLFVLFVQFVANFLWKERRNNRTGFQRPIHDNFLPSSDHQIVTNEYQGSEHKDGRSHNGHDDRFGRLVIVLHGGGGIDFAGNNGMQ